MNHSSIPRFEQAKLWVRSRIQSGELRAGDRLPGERQLARELGLAPMTVSRGLAELEAEGLIVRHVGRGSFVSAAPQVRAGNRLELQFCWGLEENDPLASAILYGALESAGRLGYELICSVAPTRYPDLSMLARGECRGVILVAPDAIAYPDLWRRVNDGLPVVVTGGSSRDYPIPSVDADNYTGGVFAVQHLLELGHQRLGLVTSDPHSTSQRDRQLGYLNAAREAGLSPHRVEVFFTELPEHLARLKERVRAEDGPTGWLTTTFPKAVRLLLALSQAGRRVPEDASIISFDDSPGTASLEQPLTVIRQPSVELGRRAVDRLHLLLTDGLWDTTVEHLAATLVVRASTAVPPAPSKS